MRNNIVTKEFSWDMAHMLSGHKGLCQNIHGHTYRMEVSLSVPLLLPSGSSEGMAIDFKDFKELINSKIVDKFDHAFVVNEASKEEMEFAELFALKGKKVFALPERTTAENMSRWIHREIVAAIQEYEDISEGTTVLVKLWETPTSCATYGDI